MLTPRFNLKGEEVLMGKMAWFWLKVSMSWRIVSSLEPGNAWNKAMCAESLLRVGGKY